MKTSNFAYWQRQRFPGAISIARYPGQYSKFTGPEFPPLMPSAQLLKAYKHQEIDWNQYERQYMLQLLCLNPEQVSVNLSYMAQKASGDPNAEPILLCIESAKTLDTARCHRRLVAQWFEAQMGLVVPEWTK